MKNDSHRPARAPSRSVKRVLLAWILPALLISMSVGLWTSAQLLDEQAEAVYDRSLAGVVRAIDVNISTESGGLALEQPYRLLEFFQVTASGNVYYRIATEDGLAEIGYPALPMPEGELPTGELRFFNGKYFDDQPVRVAVMARNLNPPLHHRGTESRRVIIQVAESLEERETFTYNILMQGLGRDVLVILLSGLLLIAGAFMALRPLTRLHDEVLDRRPDDLRPIDVSGVPSEVLPLVDAINLHMVRYSKQAALQRQFLDDASHQLRTPLSVLRTQISYALRENDAAEIKTALEAMITGLDRAVRVTNQMLALARASDASIREPAQTQASFDLNALVEETVRLLIPEARSHRLHLELALPDLPVLIPGQRLLLQEALINIIDNAIRYSLAGGKIVISVHTDEQYAIVGVEDEGVGMSATDITQAGIRFRRGVAGKNNGGAGLGLAIVKTIVENHAGQLQLTSLSAARGLLAQLRLPRLGVNPRKSHLDLN